MNAPVEPRQAGPRKAGPRKAGPRRPNPGTGARIGPNSVLQLVPLLDDRLGTGPREMLLAQSGMKDLPGDEGLMAEEPAARLHQALRAQYPELATDLTWRAGLRTADYIISHRIPPVVIHLLQHSPPWLSAPLLARTIEKHAWTFAGSGRFRIASKRPLVFELHNNPVVRGETSAEPLCHWHAAVFQRLFASLVDSKMTCIETACCAAGSDCCRFEIL
jgi:divinyl protochlorophyllide a 8-vinyl-reductase